MRPRISNSDRRYLKVSGPQIDYPSSLKSEENRLSVLASDITKQQSEDNRKKFRGKQAKKR